MKRLIFKIKNSIIKSVRSLASFFTFSVLLFMYILENYVFSRTYKWFFIPITVRTKIHLAFQGLYTKICRVLDKPVKGKMTQIDIIELSIRNLLFKKTRTFITLGGVSIGFGAIVFLVSIGYGTQNMVVKRVARLDELRQADLTPQPGSKNRLSDKTLNDVKNFTGVEKILPVISVVGKVTYQESKSDIPVYAVTSGYLTDSAIKPSHGKIFTSEELTAILPSQYDTQVAGTTTERNVDEELQFNIVPDQFVRVREKPTQDSKLLGLTRRADGPLFGKSIIGGTYTKEDTTSNEWFNSKYRIYEKDGTGTYIEKETVDGYVANVNLIVEATIIKNPDVLGLSSEIDLDLLGTASESTFTIIESDEPGFVIIPEEVPETTENKNKAVALSSSAKKQAVINSSALELFGLSPQDAVGKKIEMSFMATSSVLGSNDQKIETIPENYDIVGVIPDTKSPIVYVPFIDLKTAGIDNYSQARLYAVKKDVLADIRKQVEAMGFTTRSAADTIARINSLFATLRLVLAVMGTVALVVASLGMFNTFTVSLLERTREVGLMKAMGMKSDEIQKLFLTEAMIMGFSGGGLGVIVGFVLGKVLDFGLSAFSIARGQGVLGVTHIPANFILLIAGLSLLVGVLTGIYPATRARKISALNALRYE